MMVVRSSPHPTKYSIVVLLIYFSKFFEIVEHHLSNHSWTFRHTNTGVFHGFNLTFCSSLSSLNDGSGMTHPSAWRSSDASNEPNHRFCVGSSVVLHHPFCCFFFCTASNFTNHYYSLSFWIVHKFVKGINEVGSVEGISTNSDACGLAKAHFSRLSNGFVGQSS